LTEDNQSNRLLSPEAAGLLACSTEHPKPIIITAINPGMRNGEILSLKWSDIDFEKNVLIIDALNN